MDMGRIDDTYLLLLECSIVHRDGLGFYFGMIKCDFFFFSLSLRSDLAYRIFFAALSAEV
jgi:hypothetical protein